MSRYHFKILKDEVPTIDRDGRELLDFASVREEAAHIMSVLITDVTTLSDG